MIQQINLYQNGGKRGAHALLNPYLLSVCGVCLYLLIVGVLASQDLRNRQALLQQLQSQAQQAQSQLQSLQSRYPNQQVDALLNREIQNSQNLYQSLSHVLQTLEEDQSDHTQGFSGYLSALAAQADSGAWLTGVKIDSASDSIRLQGSTLKPEQIAMLLQRLQNTSAFKGRHFAKLSIRQSANAAELSDFSVSSHFKDDTEATHAGKH